MKMVAVKHILTLFIISKCSGIQPEYYLDNEEENLQDNENNNKTEGRRTIDQNKESSSNAYDIDHEDYDDDSDFELQVTQKSKDKYVKTTTETVTYSSVTTMSMNNNSHNETSPKKMTNMTKYTAHINIIEAYEYVYDLDSQPRQEQNDNVTIKHTPIMRMNHGDVSQVTNSAIRYLADFYNLDPAIRTIDIKKPISIDQNRSGITWYVPAKYPCWDLPILYGRLGRKKSTSDIFLVFSGSLHNVIEESSVEPLKTTNILGPNTANTINKWCATAPCFGDHVLCVFPGKKLSNLCDKGYKVSPPTMMEQIALVNTVNSMRNRIANNVADQYVHLPPAANMKQIVYDHDLEEMAQAWLRQCLPGIDQCSSLDTHYVTQLECTKSAELCCHKFYGSDSNCVPKYECFIDPVIGCLYAWFGSAGQKLSGTDVECGHATPDTFNTVQLIWAETNKIGCAYGLRTNGEYRVTCNFAPGAPFFIKSKYYCGFIGHRDVTKEFSRNQNFADITDHDFLASLGIDLVKLISINNDTQDDVKNIKQMLYNYSTTMVRSSVLDSLNRMYRPGWARRAINDYSNGSMGLIARMVTRFTFIEEGESRCDTNQPMYVIGQPGSSCIERGHRFNALCYDFGDPTPSYRLAAILAPIALFSLILYDLFDGVMRQTNY